jgi:hypothetical protein
MKPRDLWSFLPLGFLITVLIETPILLIGLSPRHSLRRRLAAGVWLTACSYPVVILVFPLIFENAPEWFTSPSPKHSPLCRSARSFGPHLASAVSFGRAMRGEILRLSL